MKCIEIQPALHKSEGGLNDCLTFYKTFCVATGSFLA